MYINYICKLKLAPEIEWIYQENKQLVWKKW